MSDDFDFIVLGAGSAGLAASFRATRHGARVALLEPALLGGTCVNVGCVPKKAMWFAANAASGQELAVDYGFASRPGALDWGAFVDRRQRYIERIHDSYRRRLREAGITVVPASGTLIGPDRVDAGSRHLRAPHILIATGSRPRRLDLPGFELGLVSDDFFALHACPERVAVVGGGYVGIELAGIYRALGAWVDLYTRGPLLREFDREVMDVLAEHMHGQGIETHTVCPVLGLHREGGGIALDCADAVPPRPYDVVQWAVGRTARSNGLGLEALGVRLGERGHVLTDEYGHTGVAGIHALGDVGPDRKLTPVAIAQARKLADRLFAGIESPPLRPETIPSVLFSHPPVATVGLTEEQARERHGDDVRIYHSRFTPMSQALASRPQRSLMKLVCVGPDERLAGVHVVGEGADEMLQGFAVAVTMGARKADLDATVAIHPTSAEELVLM